MTNHHIATQVVHPCLLAATYSDPGIGQQTLDLSPPTDQGDNLVDLQLPNGIIEPPPPDHLHINACVQSQFNTGDQVLIRPRPARECGIELIGGKEPSRTGVISAHDPTLRARDRPWSRGQPGGWCTAK
ncbi:hypothetical protein [Nocardia sp. NPDC059239]|uniref:hypothetical protein n=1 Tax=Nocardia sp. NPDC059239 TaxID=3346785 RepID=UPI0036A8CF3C